MGEGSPQTPAPVARARVTAKADAVMVRGAGIGPAVVGAHPGKVDRVEDEGEPAPRVSINALQPRT